MLRVIEYFTKSLNIIQGHCIWYYSKACGTVSYSPFIAMDISCFRDKARYWSKIVMFFIAPAFDVPVTVLPVAMTFNTQKLWYAYSMVKKSLFSRFDKIPACDGGRTERRLATASTRYMQYAYHRAVKTIRQLNTKQFSQRQLKSVLNKRT